MIYEPYSYQKKAFEDVLDAFNKGHRAVGLFMPTRSGKSLVAIQLIEKFINERVWFIGHTHILLKQMSEELTENNIRHGVLTPQAPELNYCVQVMSKETLFRRFDRLLSSGWELPNLIIIDEAHLSMSPHYVEILEKCKTCLIVGLSATWTRLDNKPFNPPFTFLVNGPSIKQLQKIGKLCRVDTYAVDRYADVSGVKSSGGDFNRKQLEEKIDRPYIIKDIVENWEKLAGNKKTLVFCASIKHAENMAATFNEAGYPARHLSSKNADEIKSTLELFYSGGFKILVSVDLFIMGFTVKDCECIIQARPTKSVMIYKQICGRGLMVAPGKDCLINIDAVNNWERLNMLPEDDVEWDLMGGKKKEKSVSSLKRCPNCQRPIANFLSVCPYCAYEFPQACIAGRELEEVEGRLVPINKLTKLDKTEMVLKIKYCASTLKEAVSIAKKCGADHRAAYYVWKWVLKKM